MEGFNVLLNELAKMLGVGTDGTEGYTGCYWN